jgi:hypothetical protein
MELQETLREEYQSLSQEEKDEYTARFEEERGEEFKFRHGTMLGRAQSIHNVADNISKLASKLNSFLLTITELT